MTDSETEILERFVIEVSQIGTVDHIVDVKAEPAGRSTYSPRRELPGEKLCDRSTRSPASEYIDLPRYADWKGLDKTAFEGDAPDEICSYCWAATLEEIDQLRQDTSMEVESRIDTTGYRLRWKQKGRAREEWYDIVVRPETTIAELDRLVCRFSTLDDFHLRMYGLEGEYLDSSLNVLPDHQYEKIDDPSYTNASDVSIGDIAERATLREGDRLSMVYDFGTPSQYYCIVKEVYDPDEIDDLLQNPTQSPGQIPPPSLTKNDCRRDNHPLLVHIGILGRCVPLFVDDHGATVQRCVASILEFDVVFPVVNHVERIGERNQLFRIQLVDRGVGGVTSAGPRSLA